MLNAFDDYPIHQTSQPLGQAGFGNPNQYDRFWYNGFREDLMFGVAFCSYPNREIMEGAFSVLHQGRQLSVHSSGRMNSNPVDTKMGPISIEIIEPMKVNRVRVDAPEHGLRADLTYTAVTEVIEEPRQTSFAGNRLTMDCTRATQWGQWTGTIEVDGNEISLGNGVAATKDRSWGARLSGAPEGAPMPPGGLLFLWAPIHFDDECFHFITFEKSDGTESVNHAMVVPKIGAPTLSPAVVLNGADHNIVWEPGQRRSRSARIRTRPVDGVPTELLLEPLMTFQMKGIGYGHPVWRHGSWHGELSVGGDSYTVSKLDPLKPENMHVQQLVRASWGNKTGLGVLEQLAIGPLPRYGFTEFLDGAPPLSRS